MKKTLVIIFSIVLCIALAGAAVALGGEGGIIKKDEPVSQTENEAQSSAQKEEKLEQTETLSAEDKALKAEIAKISDTKVDFRVNKIQKLENENYNLTYKEIDPLFTKSEEPKLVYEGKTANGYGVTFRYNINNGKLFAATWDLPEPDEQYAAISAEKAEVIARGYAKDFCDLDIYSLCYTKEYDNSYAFVFTKYISGYVTSDQVDVEINKLGEILYLRVNTNVFDNFKIESINEEAILDKLKAQVGENVNYTIDRQQLLVKSGVVCMEYSITINSENYSSSWLYTIPIE